MAESKSNVPEKSAAKRSKIRWIKLIRLLVGILVAFAIIYTAIKASKQLRESDFDFYEANFFWWFAAVGVYIVTMMFSCLFWHRVLIALGQRPKLGHSMLAFFASQLGKYVPGKAMVVVIRTDIIRGDDVQTAPAAASGTALALRRR